MAKIKLTDKSIVMDATNMTLGRLCSQVASKLRGKHLVDWQPNKLPNVQVAIINIDKLRFTGRKLTGKLYHKFSGYPGGLKTTTLEQELKKDSVRVVRQAVAHMLPKNRLNSRFLKNLKIYKQDITK
ncbi:50S ribosomal protein L13 [Patescibacteria group bacterium]|nr:50S ribosomal protein L13 [Patescibacteria group bacterium]